MGGASSRNYIVEEQLKPTNASDIPDGDFDAAKREVERLRLLISRVDCDMLDTYEERIDHRSVPVTEVKAACSAAPTSSDKTSLLESKEGQEYWGTLGKPLPREKPRQEKPEFGIDKSSMLESAEGAAYWGTGSGERSHDSPKKQKTKVLDEDGYAIVPQLSKQESQTMHLMNSLLEDVRGQIFAKTRTMEEAFLEMDADKSGFISRTEFRSCLSLMGYFITDEEFDLINRTYPHHETDSEHDLGISYLEFVTMLTGKLTYVPGFGEEISLSELDQVRALGGRNPGDESLLEQSELWHSYLVEKRESESRLQRMFSKRVFEDFYSMKAAFNEIDKDHSGFIDPMELKQVLLSTFNIEATDDAILDLMDKFDTNHDGKLAYHEFVKMLQVEEHLMDI